MAVGSASRAPFVMGDLPSKKKARNKEVQREQRKTFHELIDISNFGDVSELGVEALPDENSATDIKIECFENSTSYVEFPAFSPNVREELDLNMNLKDTSVPIQSSDVLVSQSVTQLQSLGIQLNSDNVSETRRKLFHSEKKVTTSFTSMSGIPSSTPVTSSIKESSHVTAVEPKEKQVRSIGIQCDRAIVCYEKCKLFPEKDFQFYTGLTQDLFELLYEVLGGDQVCCKLKYNYDVKTPKRAQFIGDLSAKNKLFLTLLRLRRGIPLRDLSAIFHISEGHASKVFYTWIRLMSLQFKKFENAMFVTAAAQGEKPQCFERYDNLRVIIDATEFKIQKPKNMRQNSDTFSKYKNCNTAKFLVGISCYGGLSFISEGYEGSITDRKLLLRCGFLDHLEAGDGVMADRGFDMADIADERDFDLYIPAFLNGRTYFSGRELISSRAIAESRIHVERFISKMKEFRLVRFAIPNSTLAVVGDIVRVCAFLVNFQCPYIALGGEDKET